MSARQVLKKVIPVEDAVSVLQDGDVLASSGYGGHGMPEQLLVALEQRFLDTGRPRDLTLIHATAQGDGKDRGLNHLAPPGMVSRFTNSGFLRLKLGKELERREVSTQVFLTRHEAERNLSSGT